MRPTSTVGTVVWNDVNLSRDRVNRTRFRHRRIIGRIVGVRPGQREAVAEPSIPAAIGR